MACKIGTQCYIDSNGIDIENKTIAVILSDESKVIRYSWDEGVYHIILDHKPESVDLRRKDILPILLQHNTDMLPLGIYENVRLEDGKLKANAKFDPEDDMAMEIFGKMSRGFMQTLSVGVTIHGKELEEESDQGNTYRATRWEITEASIVTVPAIPTAKVGLNNDEVATMPTASSDKIVNSNIGESMKFDRNNMDATEAYFNSLVESKQHLNENVKLLNEKNIALTSQLEATKESLEAQREVAKTAKEAFEVEKSKMAEAETRVREAISLNLDAETAVEMLQAETAEEASKLALKKNESNGSTSQADLENSKSEQEKIDEETKYAMEVAKKLSIKKG